MEQIKDTLKNIFNELQEKNKAGASSGLEGILKKVLAKNALRHVKLYNFRKGVLSIKVDSSTWLYYISLQKEDLLVKLRKNLEGLKDIRFSLGD